MWNNSNKAFLSAAIFVCFSLTATPVFAYIGPGAGLGAIGTFLAVIGSVLLLIIGFIWYPIKRLLRRKKNSEAEEQIEETLDDSVEESLEES